MMILKKPLRQAHIQALRAKRELGARVPRRLHQLASDTEVDRYPEVFRFVSDEIRRSGREDGAILSYGCSTGDECFTLRQYLPGSSIVGVDLRRKNLATCRARNQDPRIRFLRSTSTTVRSEAPYEAVFAMSVLCRWPATSNRRHSDSVYPFRRFEKAVALLDSVVKPAGLLVIYNANFRFTDSEVSKAYQPLTVPGLDDSGFVQLFSVDNEVLSNQIYPFAVFRKLASPEES
jgi:hypothetical protein